jgi:hypothetical protein
VHLVLAMSAKVADLPQVAAKNPLTDLPRSLSELR